MSIIYITHDLVTAQMVADNVLVLRRGVVVEAGRARPVIESPRHPYTRELVEANPSLDRSARWLREPGTETARDEDAPPEIRAFSPSFALNGGGA